MLMVPAHVHDVDADLSNQNVGKTFGLSKILPLSCDIVCCSNFDWYYS